MALAVLDVLMYELPQDVVHDNVWIPLAAEDRRSLRQACSQSRKLADVHTTFVNLALPVGDDTPALAEGTAEPLQAAAWQQALWQRSLYLGRLHNLCSLRLTASSGDAALTEALAQFGVVTCHRVSVLGLCVPSLSTSSACAARLACPWLRQLYIDAPTPDVVVEMDLKVFEGLMLLQLEMLRGGELSAGSLRGIGRLDTLRRLGATAAVPLVADELQSWTRLVNLCSCTLASSSLSDSPSLAAVAPLLTLTRLSCLELDLEHDGEDELEASAPVAAALQLLGALTNLRRLHLGEYFAVGDAAWAALRCLTQLTELGVDCLNLVAPADPGHLPALQRLCLSDSLTPLMLLQSLRPLLPLPALRLLGRRRLMYGDVNASELHLDIDTLVAEASVVEQARALRLASQHLAGAPHLVLKGVMLSRTGPVTEVAPLSLQQVGEGLQPLSARVYALCMLGGALPGGAEGWRALGAALPSLRGVELGDWDLRLTEASAVVLHLTALQVLRVGGVLTDSEAEWEDFARTAASRLEVRVDPQVPAP